MTRRTLLLALALALPVVWGLFVLASKGGDQTEFQGARLGMSAQQIRSSFQLPGTWVSSMEDDLLVLVWNGADSRVKTARFELHEGVLVAVRAELSDESEEQRVAADVVRDVRGGTLTIIARGCPVHADEVARLMRD